MSETSGNKTDKAKTGGSGSFDLNELREREEFLKTEEAFCAFVREVESAISREHRLWVERRSG